MCSFIAPWALPKMWTGLGESRRSLATCSWLFYYGSSNSFVAHSLIFGSLAARTTDASLAPACLPAGKELPAPGSR